MNRNYCDGLRESWDCFLLEIIVSIILIDGIFCNFDRYKNNGAEYRINMSLCQNKHQK